MKKFISLLLVISVLLGMLSCLSGCSSEDDPLTRSQWIELLSTEFGLTDSKTEEQYFTDISPEDPIYSGVQTCVDWGILDKSSSEFNPDDDALVNFALETAVGAADIGVDSDSVQEYAEDAGIIGSAFLDYNGNLTKKKAEEIIDWAKELYLSKEVEEINNVVLNENVKDISMNVSATEVADFEYVVSGSEAQNVKENDVIILPATEENPSGVARKVIGITANGDGSYTYKTEEPAIDEICSDLEVATTVVPEKEDIILAEGVSWSGGTSGMDNTSGAQIVPLGKMSTAPNALAADPLAKGLTFSLDVNFTKGKMKLSQDWAGLFKTSVDDTGTIGASKDFESMFGVGEKVTVGGDKAFSAQSGLDDTDKLGELFEKTSIIPDKNLFGKDPYDNTADIEAYKAGKITVEELKKKLNLTADQQEKKVACMTNKFAGSYEITGSLSIKDLYVQPDIKLKKVLGVPVGFDRFSVEVNYGVESTLSLKGKLTEELTVFTCPVPVGPSGVTVNVKIILFADMNGELTVKAEIDNNTKLEYKNGNFKKTATKNSSLSADLSAQLDFGPGVKVDIMILGVKVIDAKLTAAVRLKFNAGVAYKTDYSLSEEAITINRRTEYTLKFSGYAPIITLSIGYDSLAGHFGLKFSWELIGEKNAFKFDIGKENATLWKEELVIKLRDEEKEEDEGDSYDPTDYMRLENYYMSIDENSTKNAVIEYLPDKYSMDELIWETEDPNIAAVNNGVVTGKSYGSTTISVKTPDNIYTCYIAVTVLSEKVDFVPLEDDLLKT